jgi:distribution and morphology protein 31
MALRKRREQIMSNVQGLWPRLVMRIRLFLMGSNLRKFKFDDFLALFSWIVVGNAFLILAGTTLFFSIVLFLANSLQFQEYLAHALSDYIHQLMGVTITFESAIVPRWKEGVIRFKNVTVVRNLETKKEELRRTRLQNKDATPVTDQDVSSNFTMFEVTIQEIDVTLSFWRALEGKGIVKNCTLKGSRGVFDKRNVDWTGVEWDPASSRASHIPGIFELSRFTVDDMLITIHSSTFRPYTVNIFNAEVPMFRQEWLLYDIMNAEHVTGMFDNCLFSIHRLGWEDRGGMKLEEESLGTEEERAEFRKLGTLGSRISHLRVNGLPIDHFNYGVDGPFGWITSGQLDVDARVVFPPDVPDEDLLEQMTSQVKDMRDRMLDKVEEAIVTHPYEMRIEEEKKNRVPIVEPIDPLPTLSPDAFPATFHGADPSVVGSLLPEPIVNVECEQCQRQPRVKMHVNVAMNNLKASVPLRSEELSYLNHALIRPIVAYVNANRTRIPLSFQCEIPLYTFDGAWTVHDALLLDVFGDRVGMSLSDLVQNQRERTRRLKRVGLWGVRSVARNIRNVYDHVRGTRGILDYTREGDEGVVV